MEPERELLKEEEVKEITQNQTIVNSSGYSRTPALGGLSPLWS